MTTANKPPRTFKAPTTGDKAMLFRILGNVHVATSDEEITTMIRDRIAKACKRSKLKPVQGERTIQAWIKAALKIHHRNGDLCRRYRF